MKQSKKKVFVTGAGGYLGSKLVSVLVENNFFVYALYHNNKPDYLNDMNVALIQGDIRYVDKLRIYLNECEYLYHVAAYTNIMDKSSKKFHEINVNATTGLFKVAFDCGVKKAVFTSTAGVIGPSNNGTPVDEEHVRNIGFFDHYERSKAQAEDKLIELVNRYDVNIVVVNPARIYGPGPDVMSNSISRMINLYSKGRLRIMIGNGRVKANYIFIDDVVNGHLLAMKYGKKGERYLLGGGNFSYKDFFSAVSSVCDVRYKMIPVPFFVLKFVGKLAEFSVLFGRNPILTSSIFRKLQHNWSVDITKAKRDLHYRPCSLKKGIEKTLRTTGDVYDSISN